jgi:hypothetical protein
LKRKLLLLLCLLGTISLNTREWQHVNAIEDTLGLGINSILRGDLLPITFGWGNNVDINFYLIKEEK